MTDHQNITIDSTTTGEDITKRTADALSEIHHRYTRDLQTLASYLASAADSYRQETAGLLEVMVNAHLDQLNQVLAASPLRRILATAADHVTRRNQQS